MNWHSICFSMGCILVINTLCGIAVVQVEPAILEAYPPRLPGPQESGHLEIGQWISSFQKWAILCVVSAALASLLWYIWAQWVFQINRGKGAGKRTVWFLLFLVPIIISIVSCIYVAEAKSSLWLANLFFFLNGLLPYYLTTLLFSPLSFKYAPIGAEQIRSQCPW